MRRSVAEAEVISVHPPVVLMVPSVLNVALETFAPGFPKAGVFDRLNTSQRNCMLKRSFILKLRNRLPSRFL